MEAGDCQPLNMNANMQKLSVTTYLRFALNSDLCQCDSFRPKINMGWDREVVVILNTHCFITLH